ncbi:unnamed protein product [Lactuca virosa]|uniref:Uncharacterized protein n=1 Tax=Lactuca virosa TaxID=75947 RepID=A0AAU9PAY2_9ASTR|nr:unnamed protein product [Lactuca virosa]
MIATVAFNRSQVQQPQTSSTLTLSSPHLSRVDLAGRNKQKQQESPERAPPAATVVLSPIRPPPVVTYCHQTPQRRCYLPHVASVPAFTCHALQSVTNLPPPIPLYPQHICKSLDQTPSTLLQIKPITAPTIRDITPFFYLHLPAAPHPYVGVIFTKTNLPIVTIKTNSTTIAKSGGRFEIQRLCRPNHFGVFLHDGWSPQEVSVPLGGHHSNTTLGGVCPRRASFRNQGKSLVFALRSF